ncbi:MAG: LysR family transcriptional regulator [Sphingomonas sp.]
MIDRYLLRYFLAVIDAGTFSKAAAQCHVSQPTLSVGIAKLERAIGQPLFHRTSRRVELTAAGARLSAHARRIEAEFALAEQAVAEAPLRSALRLGVLVTIPMAWIEAYLIALGGTLDAHPVEIVEGRERDLIERLSRGRIDAALTIVRPESDRFAAETLFEEGYALALPAGHRLAGRVTIAAEELADNRMIVRRQCELLSDTSRHFTARGVRPFFPARTLEDDRAIAYVRAGLGVTVMPDCFRAQGIVRPRMADFPFTRAIGLLWGHGVDVAALRAAPPLAMLAETVMRQARG